MRATGSLGVRSLSVHAELIRGMRLLGRSLFCAPLPGATHANPPRSDVALANLEWDGVVDEVDLLLLASERLRRSREVRHWSACF